MPETEQQVANWFELAKAAADAGNHDEAYRYFTKILEVNPKDPDAWFGKAVAAGWGSGLRGDRYDEMLSGIQRAVDNAPDDKKGKLSRKGAKAILGVTLAYFKLSIKHTAEYIALDDTWKEHIQRCISMLFALKAANLLDPKNREVLENGIQLTKSMIEGVEYQDPYDTDSDGDPKTKVKHLPEAVEQDIRKEMDDFVAKLKAMDPNYQAPTIEKAGGEITAGGVLGCLVIVIALGIGGWWCVGKARAKLSDDKPAEAPAVTAPVATAEPNPAPAPTPTVTAPTKKPTKPGKGPGK